MSEGRKNRPLATHQRAAYVAIFYLFVVTTVTRRLNVIRNDPTSAAPLSIKTTINERMGCGLWTRGNPTAR